MLDHEMLLRNDGRFSSVTLALGTRDCMIYRVKHIFKIEVEAALQPYHTCETTQLSNLGKVNLLYSPHALEKRGLFETVENVMAKRPTLEHVNASLKRWRSRLTRAVRMVDKLEKQRARLDKATLRVFTDIDIVDRA
jgi:hypothetical protein